MKNIKLTGKDLLMLRCLINGGVMLEGKTQTQIRGFIKEQSIPEGIKRIAHNVSRSSTDQTWNPFRHVAWNQSRRGTWAPDRNDRDLEADGDPG